MAQDQSRLKIKLFKICSREIFCKFDEAENIILSSTKIYYFDAILLLD